MMKKERLNRMDRHARRGESMIFVAVVLMVFFILGASVLTAASTATGAASARVLERQTYYYARSVLDVLDESLESPDGALGRLIRKEVMRELIDSAAGSVEYPAEAPLAMTLTASFAGGSGAFSEVAVSDVSISGVGYASSAAGVGTAITDASIQMRKLDVSFTLTYRDMQTYMHVQYRCNCNVTGYDATTGTGTWNCTWEVQQAG